MVVMMAAVGCGGSVKEMAPVKEEAKSLGDPKAKAMQGMPAEMRKKMEAKK
jgi:hypothetical protein